MREALERISLDEDELKFNFGVPIILTCATGRNIVEEISANDYFKSKIEYLKHKLTKFARSVGGHIRLEEIDIQYRIYDNVFPTIEKPIF